MSSWWCGKDIAYDFCDGSEDDSCQYAHGSSGAGSVMNSDADQFNNELTTIKLYEYSQADRGAVTVFEDSNCRGRGGRLYATVDAASKAQYNQDELD